jgi:hypothetical protein
LKRKCKSRKVEAGAKSKKAERELEGKLLPFSWFSFVVLLCVLSFLCLRRRRWQQCVIIFFCGGVAKKKKTMAMCRRLLLWCYYNEEGDGSLLPSLSFLCLRKRRKRQHCGFLFCVWKENNGPTMCRHLLL